MRRFRLVRLRRESSQDSEIQSSSDWGQVAARGGVARIRLVAERRVRRLLYWLAHCIVTY